MTESAPARKSFHLGKFVLDADRRELIADGKAARLGPTAFNILLALVNADGAVVTKEDLMSRVWGHAVVGDNRLHVHINALRTILGDDCIVTKPRRGYRLAVTSSPSTGRQKRGPAHHGIGNLGALSAAEDGPWQLIGRQSEVREISARLRSGRFLTLTGPGGVGKTRLACHVAKGSARNYPDGVWLIELAALNDPDSIAGAVATALGINLGESAARLDSIGRHLGQKKLLIVLDNCEHVIGGAARVCTALLDMAANVKILTTSRQALGCPGEQIFEVPPLKTPDESVVEAAIIRAAAAVKLFTERAKAVSSAFRINDEEVRAVARICRKLDGLPLAIEIVAGWAGVLGIETFWLEFDGRERSWAHVAEQGPSRHSTLSATLEWSFDLLSDVERRLLCRLAVFAGSFSLDAAKAVVGDGEIQETRVFENLGNLIRKSMVAVVPETRQYRLLQTTRAFAFQQLVASGEDLAVRRRHARHVLDVLERALEEWESTSDGEWLARYAPLLDDLRAALEWADAEPHLAVAIAGASWPLWRELSLRSEGRRRLGAVLAELPAGTPASHEARLRLGMGYMWLNTAEVRASHSQFARAAELYRSRGERVSLGSALAGIAFAGLLIGKTEESLKSICEALHLVENGACLRTIAIAHSNELCIEASLGNLTAARAAGEKSLRFSEAIGADRLFYTTTGNMIELLLQAGDLDGAIAAARNVLPQLRRTSHYELLGFTLGLLAAALTFRGDLVEALDTARDAAPLLRDQGMLFWFFDHLALRAAADGRVKDAARIAGYTDADYRKLDRSREPIALEAVNRLQALLSTALPEVEILQLRKEGSLLTEQQALALALSPADKAAGLQRNAVTG